ncbi:hypothetical protein [Streptomyces sp. NPDC054794]
MPESPQRPLRPDEEDLVRFHSGDTLDNIPIVSVSASDPVGRWSWLPLAGMAVAVAVVSGFAVAGAMHLAADDGSRTDAQAPVQPTEAGTADANPSSPSGSSVSPSPSLKAAAQSQLEQVRVIQAPATGGDPGTSYCLVYTGSDGGGVKDAILLANAPAYQCTDLLAYDPDGAGSFSTDVPSCELPARAAVLSFAESSEWAGTVYFTCLTRHTGA